MSEQENTGSNKKIALKLHYGSKVRHPKTSPQYWKDHLERQTEGGWYSIHPYCKGQRHRITLNTANKEEAAKKAATIYVEILTTGWDRVLTTIKGGQVKPDTQDLTLGQYLELVEPVIEVRPNTLKNYKNFIRQIVAEICNIEDQPLLDEVGNPCKSNSGNPLIRSRFDYVHGGAEAWRQKVDSMPLTVLNLESIHSWKMKKLAEASSNPLQEKRKSTSIRTAIRNAKALFAPKILKHLSEVTLPNPLPFEGVEVPPRGNTRFKSQMDFEEIIIKGSSELEGEAAKIFFIVCSFGLRKAEIDNLTWQQIDLKKGILRVVSTPYHKLKSEDSEGDIKLEPHHISKFAEWKQHAKDKTFVVQSPAPYKKNAPKGYYRCEAIYQEIYAWIRSQGIITDKPLHELRKEVGSLANAHHGIFASQKLLRHASHTTTVQHYVDDKNPVTSPTTSIFEKNLGE